MSLTAKEIEFYDNVPVKDVEQTYIERARAGDILAFTKYTMPEYQINWHHRKLAKALNKWLAGEIKYLMVFMPPRHGKSELVSRRLPAFIHGLHPNTEIMAASYLDSLAGDMTTDVQKIMDSKAYKQIFPDVCLPKARSHYSVGIRNTSEHNILNSEGVQYPKGKYRGQGVGGSFTGKGANWIIVDDPIKGREQADSEAFRRQLWNFWTNDLYSRLETDLNKGREGQVLITQTRWHEDDLSGRLLTLMKKDPLAMQFEIVHFPAIRVDRDNKEDPRELGEALWPKKYSVPRLNEIRATTTPRGWSAVYQQNPVPGDGALFKEGMFAFRDIGSIQFDWTFITADTAYKEKEQNDFTVFSHWGVINEGKDLYLIDIWRDQIAAVDIEDKVEPFLREREKYGFRCLLIEPKGHGIYLNQAWSRKGFMIPSENDIAEFYRDRRHDKVERANNVVPHLARRKIYFNNDLANKEELVAECLGFPNAMHDDFVDTVIDALKKVHGAAPSILDVL